MKAVVLNEYGGADRLQLRDVPDPPVGPGQIKVRVAGASVNPIDWKLRSGAHRAFMPLELPAILGRDASGTVIEVGPGVTAFKIGDRVLGRVNQAYAEQIVGPTDAWAEVPANLDLTDAAALPLVLLTGAQLIDDAVKVAPGDRVLVTGALGSVGRVALFVARSRGAQVVAGVRGSQKAEAAKLGADEVLALDDDRALDQLAPVDSIADTVNGETIQKLLGKVKPGGTIGSVLGEPAGASARGLVVRAIMARPDPKRLGELAQAVAQGKLVIPIAARFPLAQAREAHQLAEAGAAGKVILTA
jgi:NADPH:quinone reductase-like Zn-dependent oxidoreductase